MKIKHQIYFLGLLIFLISACQESEIPNRTNKTYISEDLKNEFVFEKGSYWIYENNNGNIDSVILYDLDSGFTSICPDNGCPQREYIKMKFQNMTRKEVFNHYFVEKVIKYNGGGNWGQDGQPIFVLNIEIGESSGGLIFISHYDSLEVMEDVFYNVDIMGIKAKEQFQDEFDFNTDLFFSPHVGVIRKIIYDTINGTEIWNIKRYEIKK